MFHLTETWPLWGLLLVPLSAAGLFFTLTDRPPGKRYAAFGLRALSVVLLVLALCRPTLDAASDRVHAVFAVDVSASVDLADAAARLDDVDAAVAALGPGDTHALLAVADSLRPVADTAALRVVLEGWRTGVSDDRFRSGTDLAAALSAARLTLPDDAAARLVLLTDARPTTPGFAEALTSLRGEGIDVQRVPLAGLPNPEVAVTALSASPAFAHEGELVRLSATVQGNRTGPAEVRFTHRGLILARRDVDLIAGVPSRAEVSFPMLTPGRTVWTAEVVSKLPAGPGERPDHFALNNAVAATVHVTGRPRVLVLHETPRAMAAFANAMEKQDLAVEVRPAEGCPTDLAGLLAFDAIVLADVPATDLSPTQLTLLRRYVADFGGGLAMFGSENSFGLGGYYRTPVEEVLPLSSRFEQEKEKPSMAMVLVIDKSGSMQGLPIALARQAAKAAVELLGPQDQVGVVGFDGEAFVAVPLQPAGDRAGIQAAIDRIGAGGGTFMFAGMDAAREMLDGAAARIKHLIVLGDGQTQPADHDGLVQALVDRGATVSTVALGSGADRPLMARIAEAGRGRYYETMDPNSVPQIFTRETMQASRSAIKEDLFSAVVVGDHPLLSGYENAELPFSLGYVMTRPRPTARVLLATDTGDPLLAINPFGLGQGLSFTADLTERWGGEWLAWPANGRFWAQALRALVRRPNTADLSVETSADAETLTVTLTEPLDAAGALATPTAWSAEALDDAGRREVVAVRPVGVGRYAARAPVGKSDRLTLRLVDAAGNRLRTVQHDRPYSAEYRLDAEPDSTLAALPVFAPAGVRAGLAPAVTSRNLTPWLLLAAIACFTAGVLLRRV